MKKILTKEEKKRKQTRLKIILGGLLVAIMILSSVGFAFFSSSEKPKTKIEEGGIEFILNENGLWEFELQGFKFLTQYTLKETENISAFAFRTMGDYSGKTLFFLGQSPARREIEVNLVSFVPRMQDGCLEDYKERCNNNTPIKNCSQDNVIILEETEEIKIHQEDNCVFIEAPYEEQARAADALLFKILGIRNF